MSLLNRRIAVCGKGGVGKTTVSALIARAALGDASKKTLMIDADPGAGLSMALGLPIKRTVNDIRIEVINAAREKSSDLTDTAASIDYQLMDSISERGNVALLSVGRPEEEGCYCQLNSFLREAIESLSSRFELTVVDAEAGIEQINRRVIRDVSLLLLVTDPTVKGIRVVEQILEASKSSLKYERAALLVNKANSTSEVEKVASLTDIPVAGAIPSSRIVSDFDLNGISFFDIPSSGFIEIAEAILRDLHLS